MSAHIHEENSITSYYTTTDTFNVKWSDTFITLFNHRRLMDLNITKDLQCYFRIANYFITCNNVAGNNTR